MKSQCVSCEWSAIRIHKLEDALKILTTEVEGLHELIDKLTVHQQFYHPTDK